MILYTCPTHPTVHLRCMNFIISKLQFNKADYTHTHTPVQAEVKAYTLCCLERLPMGKGGKWEWNVEVKKKGGEKKEDREGGRER